MIIARPTLRLVELSIPKVNVQQETLYWLKLLLQILQLDQLLQSDPKGNNLITDEKHICKR